MKCVVLKENDLISNVIEAEEGYILRHAALRAISEEEARIYYPGQRYAGAVFEQARTARAQEFAAFDIYKSNVAYGIETDSDEERAELLDWYQKWLDFPATITTENYQSLTYPQMPEFIKKYMKSKED